jgi:hypothetical protein
MTICSVNRHLIFDRHGLYINMFEAMLYAATRPLPALFLLLPPPQRRLSTSNDWTPLLPSEDAEYILNTTNLIHTSLSLSLSLLFGFKASTCFGHQLPIFRRHYTHAFLVSASWRSKHVEALNPNKSESESESESAYQVGCLTLSVSIPLCVVNV